MLHPKVRIAVLLRDLLEFLIVLRKNLIVTDIHNDISVVDKGNVDLYLKVITHIINMYKSETCNMLFTTEVLLLRVAIPVLMWCSARFGHTGEFRSLISSRCWQRTLIFFIISVLTPHLKTPLTSFITKMY